MINSDKGPARNVCLKVAISVIFVNENENDKKWENNEFVN